MNEGECVNNGTGATTDSIFIMKTTFLTTSLLSIISFAEASPKSASADGVVALGVQWTGPI